MNKRPELTLSEVTERFEISRATLKRRLANHDLVGASKDPRGTWRIPIEALQADGIKAKKTWLTELGQLQMDPAHDLVQPDMSLQNRVIELERELAHELAQRQKAEAIADERKERIGDLQRALAVLEAPRNEVSESSPRLAVVKRWWRRR